MLAYLNVHILQKRHFLDTILHEDVRCGSDWSRKSYFKSTVEDIIAVLMEDNFDIKKFWMIASSMWRFQEFTDEIVRSCTCSKYYGFLEQLDR